MGIKDQDKPLMLNNKDHAVNDNMDAPLYNSGIIKTYLEYLARYYPDVSHKSLLEYADITEYEIEDPAHYLTQGQINRFHERLVQATNNPDISREAGRYVASAEVFGTIKTHLMGILSPLLMYEIMGRNVENLSRHITFKTKKLGPNRIEVNVTPKPDVHEEPFQCENRMGALESLTRLRTNTYADIEHPQCIHRGDEQCRYIISWEPTQEMMWKKIRYTVLFICAFWLIFSFSVFPSSAWGIASLAALVLAAAVVGYTGHLEKQSLRRTLDAQSRAARDLLDQTNTQYGNALLIQELGQATTTVMPVPELCRTVTELLRKYLDFEKGMVLLADRNTEKLIPAADYGFSDKESDFQNTLALPLNDTASGDTAPATCLGQRPVLISDTSDHGFLFHDNLTAFLDKWHISSFIGVPIVYERECLGVLLTADPSPKRPLTVSDQNLLTGVASQLAVSITNAGSFERIQESEQRYRTIFQSTSNPTIIIEEDTTISLANIPFEKLSGYSREELEHKKSWTEFIVPEDVERMKHRHSLRRLNPESTEKNYEFRFQDRHGAVKNIFLTVDLIPNTTTSVASLLDITERIKAEEALRKSEERYRLLAENVHDVIWVLDKDFSYTYISPSVETLKGFTVDEAMAMTLEEIYTPQSYETVKKVITAEMEHYAVNGPDPARSRIFETEQICKDGSTVWTEVTASILYDENGNVSGFLGITRDISERKKAEYEKNLLEAQLQHAHKMEAIGTLAGGIAHDFNNLLMGIQGNASLLLADIDPGHPHTERLKNIERYVRGGADLTRQLLGFARGGKYEVKPTNINDLVGKSSEMFGRTRKEITIHRRFEEDIWTVEVDRGQIEQVMLNLYVNAWQAMEPGGKIFLETNNVVLHEEFVEPYLVKPGRYVHISVTDTGSGMDEETAKRVFEPFFTTKELSRGTGLGLASAYGIIVNHDGIIDVSSRKGAGTTFNIYLPASKKAVPEERPKTSELVQGTGTVLLVDDEDLILDIGKEILERLGYRVITAKGGHEAARVFKENRSLIDLVILDMIMPDLSGGETYDALKEIDPGVKVLLSSGYSLESRAKDILERGCNGFIQKPFDLKALSVKIHEIIEG